MSIVMFVAPGVPIPFSLAPDPVWTAIADFAGEPGYARCI